MDVKAVRALPTRDRRWVYVYWLGCLIWFGGLAVWAFRVAIYGWKHAGLGFPWSTVIFVAMIASMWITKSKLHRPSSPSAP